MKTGLIFLNLSKYSRYKEEVKKILQMIDLLDNWGVPILSIVHISEDQDCLRKIPETAVPLYLKFASQPSAFPKRAINYGHWARAICVTGMTHERGPASRVGIRNWNWTWDLALGSGSATGPHASCVTAIKITACCKQPIDVLFGLFGIFGRFGC